MTELDRIDIGILALLQKDGRSTNKELADAVGLSASSCHERVRRLRDTGVIRGFHAEVDDKAMGIGIQAFVEVKLVRHSRDYVDSFWNYALSVDEVIAVYHVTGDRDFVMHVVVHDTDHLRDVLLDRFTSRDEIDRVETHILFSHQRKSCRPSFVPAARHGD